MLTVVHKVSRESWIIAAMCLIDLTLTCIWVHGQTAREGNPIMNFYLQHGMAAFIGSKLALIAGPILILEWARRIKPKFVTRIARFTIAAYLGAYGVMFMRINVPTLLRSGAPAGGYESQVDDADWQDEAYPSVRPSIERAPAKPTSTERRAGAEALAKLP